MKKHLKHMAKFGRKMSRVSQTKKFKTKFAGFVIVAVLIAMALTIPTAQRYVRVKTVKASSIVTTHNQPMLPQFN